MAGQYRFKDSNGNIVAQISASVGGAISFSGSVVDFTQANNIILGNVQLAGTASNALLLDGFDSQAFAFTSSIHPFTASIAGTNTFTSSASTRLNSIETITASNVSRLNSLEIKTGSLATTGSNTFIGTQTITGSLFISSDLVVQGSSSLQNITASAVSIGTNIVNLNTANPAIRYAGLSIGDSGSVGGSGSFLYDSVQDEMIFVHRGANSTVTSSVTLMGPQTFDNVGNETYPTLNIIQKGTGNEHLGDSCIFDNGTTVCVNATLKASGQVCGIMSNFSCMGIGTITPQSTLHIGPSLNSMPAATSIAVPGDTSIRFMAGSDGNANYGSFIAGTQVAGVRALSLGSRQGEGDIVTMTLTQGNVGIGAISPNAPLHICNTCTITNMSIQNVNCAGYALYQAKSAGTAYTWQWGSWNDGTYRVGQSGVGDYMTITNCGKVGILATDPKWLLEICCNSTSGGAGGYPAVTINNPNVAGYAAYYFYKGASQMGGMEISNSTCNILINTLSTLNFQVQGSNKLTITNDTACFSSSPSNIMGLGTKVHEGTYNVYTGASCVLTLPINYGSASSVYLFGTLLGNDSMHYAHMMYYYRNDFAGFVGSTITQMSCHNTSTAGQRYTFSIVDPGGLGKSGCPLQINITCANGPSVGAGSYYTRFKIVVYNI